MNLATARAELESRGYARFTDARLEIWLNTAKNRFEDYQFDWPWLKSTATGAAPLTIADLRRVRSVADTTNQRPLEMINPDANVDFFDYTLTRPGTPTGWYLSSETIVSVYPVQTTSLSVRYVKFSPELTGTDTPLIPVRYHQTWVDLAEVDALRYGVKDRDSANSMELEVFRRIEEIAVVYAMQSTPANDETLITGASVDG